MRPIQRYLLEKIATQWKEAANDFGWFDPRVWQQVFNPKRVKAQQEYYQSAIKPDTVTLANGQQVKDFSREQARANYYKDQHTYTRRDGKGNSWQVTTTGTPVGYASDPAKFEAQNDAYFKQKMETGKKYGYGGGGDSKRIVGYNMAQGPDMTKNMPMTAFQREWKNSKLELDKQFSRLKQITPKTIDAGITWGTRALEMTGIPTATRAIAKTIDPNSTFGESGERFTPWDKITGKSQTWFQKQQAPKHNAFWRGVGKVNQFAENYITGNTVLDLGIDTALIGATGGLSLVPKAVARGLIYAPHAYNAYKTFTQNPAQQPQQPNQPQQSQQPQQFASNYNPYGYNQNSNYSDDHHTEFGYMS